MAGVKGKSGGARPGAGRKPNPKDPPKPLKASAEDPVDWLTEVMHDEDVDPKLRVRAAIAAAQYKGTKKGEKGKKDEEAEAAKGAGGGKFAPGAPPAKLTAVK